MSFMTKKQMTGSVQGARLNYGMTVKVKYLLQIQRSARPPCCRLQRRCTRIDGAAADRKERHVNLACLDVEERSARQKRKGWGEARQRERHGGGGRRADGRQTVNCEPVRLDLDWSSCSSGPAGEWSSEKVKCADPTLTNIGRREDEIHRSAAVVPIGPIKFLSGARYPSCHL